MIITAKPKKFKLYVNSQKKTAAQVKSLTGANIVINCWLYNMKTFKANCDVKVDGAVLSDDQYKYWGYGFNANDSRMTMSNDINAWENYFSCVGMLKDGKKLQMYYDSAVGRSCERSAVGFKADGSIVVLCDHSKMTVPEVQEKMLSLGCVDAINMDGGGSAQCASDYGNLTSSRRVHGYLCIWVEEDEIPIVCPYKEPTANIKKGSIGTGAKWVQWHLQRIVDKNLSVDGIFGNNSKNALIAFQKSVFTDKADWDGICGKKTRVELKKAI